MHNKNCLSAMILFILCFAVIGQVFAQTTPEVTVGVKEGDWFKYQVAFFWNSTNPSDTVPLSYVEANTTEYLLATITTVTGTTVTISEVQHYQNGTETTKEELTNVATATVASVLLYASNLNAGGYLFPLNSATPIINSTVTRTYAGAAREDNYVVNKATSVDINSDGEADYVYRYTSLYFDRQTGILVDAYFEDVSATTPSQTVSWTLKLTETNAWTAGSTDGGGDGGDGTPTSWLTENLLYIIVIVVVVAVVVVVAGFVLVRKRKSKSRRQ